MSRLAFRTMVFRAPIPCLASLAMLSSLALLPPRVTRAEPPPAVALHSSPYGAFDPRTLDLRFRADRLPPAQVSRVRSEPAGDALWSDAFGLPVFDGSIFAMAEFRGELIVAGNFRQAGGVPANHMARWDGQRWAPLGEGLYGVPTALIVVGDRLYAGGYDGRWFTGLPSILHEWDGAAWTNITANLAGGAIGGFAVWQGSLVAGGLVELGSKWVPGVMRYQGGQWDQLGDLGTSGAVQSIVSDGTTIYVGGTFGPQTRDVAMPIVLGFSGGTWDTVARARDDDNIPYGFALALDHGDLIVGGGFDEVEGVPAASIARLHAGVWVGAPGVSGPYVTALRTTSDGVLVGGFFSEIGGVPAYSLSRWTESGWEALGSGLSWGVFAILEYQGRVVAGGQFTQDASLTRQLVSIASWDGASWTAMRGTIPAGAGVLDFIGDEWSALEVIDGSLYLGGSFHFENDLPFWPPARGVARWNGTGWTPIGPREFNGTVHALAWYEGHLIAGGGFGLPSGVIHVARWSGTNWEPLGTGIDGVVYALTVWSGELYAAGGFNYAGGLLSPGIARWDGVRWRPAGPSGPPGGNPRFDALAVYGGRLIAGGEFTAIGNVTASNVAAWNGQEWLPLAEGRPGPVRALEVHDGRLWAGGERVPNGAEWAPSMASWDGGAWTSPNDTPAGRVLSLHSTAGSLFVAGAFTQVGAMEANGIVELDGNDWRALGSGIFSSAWVPAPSGLAEYEGALWVAGAFTLAGGKSSFHVARWNGLPVTPASPLTIEPARPNPFARSTSVRFRLPPHSTGSVAVLDLGGRLVRTLRKGPFGSGPIDVTWDGRDDGGKVRPAGVYFIRLNSNAGDRTARVAFVP